MVSPFKRRRSSEHENRSPTPERSQDLTNNEATSEIKNESDYEDEGIRTNLRQRQTTSVRVGGRLVKHRRVRRSEEITQEAGPARAATPSLTSSSSAVVQSSPTVIQSSPVEDSSQFEETVSVKEESPQPLPLPFTVVTDILQWKDMPYPGFPQIGYAFSYASGPICFIRVGPFQSRSLNVHSRPTHNYVAYVFYTPNPNPHIDSKFQGLEMLNELAAHGFIEDDEDGNQSNIHEEMVGDMRALSFSKAGVVVSLPRLGDRNSPRAYLPEDKPDQEDQNQILYNLQSIMHPGMVPPQPFTFETRSPPPRPKKHSTVSKLQINTRSMSSKNQGGTANAGVQETSLEDSGLIKFVKVHWRRSKLIRDNVHLIRPGHWARFMNPAIPKDPDEEETFKAVIVWSNKKEKKEGINLLERMAVAKLGGQELRKGNYLKDTTSVVEYTNDGQKWLVIHKNDVVIGFPETNGDEVFIESLKALEIVWN